MTILGLPSTVSEDTKVSVLAEMGFQPNEIASMTGSSANAVRVRLYKLRKKAKGEVKVEEQAKDEVIDSGNNNAVKANTAQSTGT
jgi:hypothetical protein